VAGQTILRPSPRFVAAAPCEDGESTMTLVHPFRRVTLAFCAWSIGALAIALAQQPEVRFGDAYSGLDVRRQQLVDNWVARFSKVTGKPIEAGPFYDDVLTVSTKTTFDAVTHALMTTLWTDRTGASLGDALALVDQVDSIRGEVDGAASDRQFRIYVRLVPGAIDILERSQQFTRGMDNSVYHKGYPINYRAQGGVPSIQISVALDRQHSDIDYRSSMFPASLLNGQLVEQLLWRKPGASTVADGVIRSTPEDPARRQGEHRRHGRRFSQGLADRRGYRGGHGLHLGTFVRLPRAG
jgi:hypothetical protein